MIRRPPRSTPLSLHDALPIWSGCLVAEETCLRGRREARARRADGHLCFQAVHGPVEQATAAGDAVRSEEHTSELQSRQYLVCRLLLEKKTYGRHFSLLLTL